MVLKKIFHNWLFNVVLFTFIFLFLFVEVSYWIRPYNDTDAASINISKFKQEDAPVDVLWVGGSSTYVYLMPLRAYDKYGFTSYNYSGDSMSPTIVKNLIAEARKHQKSNLYAIDLRAFEILQTEPTFYSEEYIRKYTDAIPYSLNRYDMIKSSLEANTYEPKNKLSMYLDIIYYHDVWHNALKNNPVRTLFGIEEKSETKGYYFPGDKPEAISLNDYSNVTERLTPSPVVEQTMSSLLRYCKEEDLNVLFYVSCYSDPDAESKMLYNTLSDMAAEYGYRTLNLNDCYNELDIDENNDFYNINHVNVRGAMKVTDYMAKYISENYDLKDRRNDSEFSEWNDYSEAFKQKTASFLSDYNEKYKYVLEEKSSD